MIFLLGFRTPNNDEVPEILYIGNDGDEVNRRAEASKLPRLARMTNPALYPIKHWSEEASEAFEAVPPAGLEVLRPPTIGDAEPAPEGPQLAAPPAGGSRKKRG